MKLTDITAGQSWACKFKVMTFLDSEGNVVDKQLNIVEKHQVFQVFMKAWELLRLEI